MKFSLFHLAASPEGTSEVDEFQKILEQCEVADRLGFDTVWFAEHHFSRVGMCPDALMMALAASQRTRRMRVGTAISILPFHNPVRLAEQAAMVDVLSGGRLDLGVGRGSQPKEFQGFDISPSDSKELLREGLEVLCRLMKGERLTFQGKHYSCTDVEIHPHFVQKPHPPLWLAGTSLETYTLAGKEGYNIMASASFKGPEVYREKMSYFQEAVRARGGDPMEYPSCLLHNVHVCDDPEAAWGLIEPAESWYLAYRSAMNAVDMSVEEQSNLARNWSYDLNIREVIEGGGVIGPPGKVIEEIRRIQSDYGANHLMLFSLRGIPQEEAVRSLERFASEVMPVFESG